MKKNFSFVISTLIIFSLALTACGGNKAATESSSPAAVKTDTANSEAFSLKVGAWFHDDLSQSTDFKAAAEAKFKEKYPNAKVE